MLFKNSSALLAALFLVCGTSFAANITWTNANSNGLWSDPLNWSTGSTPGSSDIAIFDGTSTSNCALDAAVSINGMDIRSGYSGTIAQAPGIGITIGSGNFTQADGVFQGGDSNFDINGEFFLSGGSFFSTSAKLSVGRNINGNITIFSHSGGNFYHNSGYIEFDPTCTSYATRTYTIDVLPSTEFNELTLDATSTSAGDETITTASGDTIRCVGRVTHDDGQFNGLLSFEGDLVINADANSGSGWFIFNGAGNQNYSIASGTPRTAGIAIDKDAGSAIATSTEFQCNRYSQLKGDVIFPSGSFNIGGNWNSNITLFNHQSGAIDHNNGTVEFDPTCTSYATRTFTVDVSSSTLFNDLILDATSTSAGDETITTASGDTLFCAGSIEHDDGKVNGIFALAGDLDINGDANGGSGWFVFNGSSNQRYKTTGGSPRTIGIAINKPSGTVSSNGSPNLYCQRFDQVQGDFTAPSSSMYVGGSWNSNITLFNHQGGSFDHNNGTVIFDPICTAYATRTFTIDIYSGTLFNDIILDATSTSAGDETISTASGDTAFCIGSITHNDGVVNGIFALEDDLFIDQEANGGSGWFVFNGTGTQKYRVTGGSPRTIGLAVEKNSGVVSAQGTSTLYCQRFNQILGDFVAPSSNMYIGGSWNSNVTLFNHQNGSFDHNNGTIEFDPTCTAYATRTFTVDVSSSTLFNDLILDATSTSAGDETITTASGDTLFCEGSITHDDGVVNGTFATLSDLTINSTANGGSGWFVFNGTGPQSYQVSGGSPRTVGLAVLKTSGTVSPVGTSTLYCQRFNQILGDFVAPSSTMYIGGSWNSNITLFNHQNGSFDHNNGTVEFDPTCTAYATRTFTVDVSSSTLFNDLILDATSTSAGDETITTVSGDTLFCEGSITHDDGVVNGTFATLGDLTINSTANGGSGWFVFNGTGPQSYQVSGGSPRTIGLAVDKVAGSVSCGSVDFSCQRFLMLNGDFSCPSGTFRIGGNWNAHITLFDHSGGSLSHNNGTIEFDPTCYAYATRTYTLDVLPYTRLNDVILDASSSSAGDETISIASGDTLTISGDLTLEDGVSNGGWIRSLGDVTILPTMGNSRAPILFAGGSDQYLDLTGTTGKHNGSIGIQKSAGDLILSSDMVMDAGNGNDLYLHWGHMVAGTNEKLTIGDDVECFNASDSSLVRCMIEKTGNDLFTFPIGNDTIYAPITIDTPNSGDTITAQYFWGDPDTAGFAVDQKDASLVGISRCEYWSLTRTGGSSSEYVGLSWGSPRSCGVNDETELLVAGWNGSQWADLGGTNFNGNTNAGSLRSGTQTSTFQIFTLGTGSGSNPLPIDLLNFTALANGPKVDLSWSTAAEINNDFFTIERSKEGNNWEIVEIVQGAGNSNSTLYYALTDHSPISGTSYYRLKQTDFNGDFTYSNIESVHIQSSFNVVMYPNPAQSMTTLEVADVENMEIELINSIGQLVPVSITKLQGKALIALNGLPKGLYYVSLEYGSLKETQKLLVE